MEQEQESRLGKAEVERGRTEESPFVAPAGLGPVLLFIPLLVAALVALHMFRNPSRPTERFGDPVDEPPFEDVVQGWRSTAPDGPSVKLIPYRLSRTWNAAWGEALAERYGLEAGELWRLEFDLGEGPFDLDEVRVAFADGEFRDFEPPASEPLDLLTNAAEADGGVQRTYLLWGPRTEGSVTVKAKLGESDLELALDPYRFETLSLTRSPWRMSGGKRATGTADEDGSTARDRAAEIAALEERIVELENAFQMERARRQERELEWYEFNRTLSALELDDLPRFTVDESELPEGLSSEEEAEAGTEDTDPQARARVAALERRSHELFVSMRALFLAEQVSSLDLLEGGLLKEGALGPVVFRLLDHRGRLAGTLNAKRLRLEASRAARTLTVVLEEGGETRSGEYEPFRDGTRRILFHDVTPDPWIERMEELFAGDVMLPPDDGLWNKTAVREELNRLLALETSLGWFRVRALAGVMGNELREVHVEELERSGAIRRRLFADRMLVKVEKEGVLLELFDGMTMQGENRQAFLNGKHAVFLSKQPLADWRRATLPGVGFAERTDEDR